MNIVLVDVSYCVVLLSELFSHLVRINLMLSVLVTAVSYNTDS